MPSQEPTRIMVTGAGAPGIAGTIWALRNNPENSSVWIMGVDVRDAAVGRYVADDFRWERMGNRHQGKPRRDDNWPTPEKNAELKAFPFQPGVMEDLL